MAAVLKVECEGEIRRLLFEETPDYEAVRAALRQLWPAADADLAKYKDEEGDACTLTDVTFADFLGAAGTTSDRLVLRVQLPAPAKDAPTAPPAAADQVPHKEPEAPALPPPSNSPSNSAVDFHIIGAPIAPQSPLGASDLAALLLPDGPTEEASAPVAAAEQAMRPAPSAAAATTPTGGDGPANLAAESPEAVAEEAPLLPDSPTEQGAAPVGAAEQALRPAPSAAAAATPTGGDSPANPAAESPEAAAAAAAGTALSEQEKMGIVLAAFDENGDGHLNFDECNKLLRAAWGWRMPWWGYQRLCAQIDAKPEVGLGPEALAAIYAHNKTLEWDYEVARRKLAGELPEYDFEPCPWYVPVVAGGAVLMAPILAVPLAAAAAARWWRWTHGPLQRQCRRPGFCRWGHGCQNCHERR